MITNYIKYIDHNKITINDKKTNKRVEELINKGTPYKEMSEEEIEKVVMYHAMNIAKIIVNDSLIKKREKIFYESLIKQNENTKKQVDKHLEMCNAIIEKEKAQREYYEKKQS